MPPRPIPDPKTVMVYSMGEVIGDGVIKLPFVAAVREAYPHARITWCAGKGSTVYATTLKPAVEGTLRVLKAAEDYAAAHRGDPPIESPTTF